MSEIGWITNMTPKQPVCLSYLLVMIVVCVSRPARAQAVFTTTGSPAAVDIKAVQTGTSRGIEEEILGPLRIWHVIFIIAAVLTAALVIVCCCCGSFRVPRTRQEIEENYRKRMMNKNYLRILERNPEDLLKRHQVKIGVTVTKASGKLSHFKAARGLDVTQPSSHATTNGRTQTSHPRAIEPRPHHPTVQSSNGRTGIQTPQPFHPRDLLSLMPQRTQKGEQPRTRII